MTVEQVKDLISRMRKNPTFMMSNEEIVKCWVYNKAIDEVSTMLDLVESGDIKLDKEMLGGTNS